MKKAIIPLLIVVVLLSGCAEIGAGNVVTEEKGFSDFKYVEVTGTFEVEIVQSDTFNTTIEADETMFDYVSVTKERDTLKISLSPRHTFTDFTLQAKTLKATVTMPSIYGLELSGASKGAARGFKSLDNFNLDVSGASSLDMDDIKVGDLSMEVSGASRVSGNMTAADIKLELSGASKVELAGLADDIMLKISGASTADLADFLLDNASAKLSGASEVTLNVKGKLDASVSDASRLYFLGNPTMGNISVTGASTIKHK